MKKIKTTIIVSVTLLLSVTIQAQTTRKKTTNAKKQQTNVVTKESDSKKVETKTVSEKDKLEKPYNPKDNAEEIIGRLMVQAENENKNIILQAGGNWCIWCLRLNDFINKDEELSRIKKENFLYYHLNFSPENKNTDTFKKYNYPGDKHGYPVLLVLDPKGNLLHTQETGSLEDGKGYNKEKVLQFFKQWIKE